MSYQNKGDKNIKKLSTDVYIHIDVGCKHRSISNRYRIDIKSITRVLPGTDQYYSKVARFRVFRGAYPYNYSRSNNSEQYQRVVLPGNTSAFVCQFWVFWGQFFHRQAPEYPKFQAVPPPKSGTAWLFGRFQNKGAPDSIQRAFLIPNPYNYSSLNNHKGSGSLSWVIRYG